MRQITAKPLGSPQAARRPVSGRLVLGVWLLLAGMFVLAGTWNRLPQAKGVFTYLGLWATLAAACLVFAKTATVNARLKRPMDILEIPIYLSLTSLGFIGIFGAAPYFDSGYLLYPLYSLRQLPSGLLLTGAGLISMWLGYALVVALWAPASSLATAGRRPSPFDFSRPSLQITLLTYAALALLRLVLLFYGGGERFRSTTQIGDWQQWLTYTLELRWMLVPLLVLQAGKGKWPRSLVLPILVFEAVMAVLAGWTSSLLRLAIIVFGCIRYYRLRIPLRVWIMALLVLSLLAPVARSTRTASVGGLPAVVTAAAGGTETFVLGGPQGALEFSWSLLVHRQSATAQTPAVIQYMTPSVIPYRPLEEIALVPFSIVPRVLWPSKPAYGELSTYVTTAYFGLDPIFGASDPTMAGSAYMYGGWWLAGVAMFLVGVASALFYIGLAAPALLRGRVGLLAVYVGVMISNFHIGEGDVIGLWQGVVQRTAVFLVIAVLLCARRAPGPRARPEVE